MYTLKFHLSMKKYFSLIFLFACIQSLQSQENIIGQWKIDFLISLWYNQVEDHQEYNLYNVAQSDGRTFDWGNWASFNPDGTFISYYTAPCGNDCFPNVYGQFKLLDDDRVLLHVDSILIGGFCKNEQFYPNKDLGVFKIFPTDSGFKLIKSEASLGSDSENLAYSQLIDSFEWNGSNAGKQNQLNWVPLKSNSLTDLMKGLGKVTGYDATKIRILYSKHLAASKAVLFEYNGEKRLAFYYPHALQFAIFDDPL